MDRVKYQTDLAECRDYGQRVSPLADGLIGASLGVVAGILGNSIGGSSPTRAVGMGIGAGIGVTKGFKSQLTVVDTCLTGRGYKLLKPGFDYF